MTIDRRRFLQLGMTATGGVVLFGCSSDDTTSTADSNDGTGPAVTDAPGGSATADVAPSGTDAASTGGSIRIGALASPADTLNPASATGLLDYMVLYHVHDSLQILQGGTVTNQLAESIEPNNDATEWTVTLVDGATFHDGAPVTAADVVYSLTLLASSANFAQFYAAADLDNIEIVDDRTLVIPLLAPRGDFADTTFAQLSFVVPDGFTDWGNNIGSGPYTLVSYEPGVGAKLERNPDYWGTPALLDTLEFVAIADAPTRLNALKSGEIDFASGVDAIGAAAEEGNDAIEIRRGSQAESTMRCFALNVNQAPFDNPDVVRAVKLAIDRQALIDVVLLGSGELGNDIPSAGLPGYPAGIAQTERDVDTARELFEAAGVTEFTIRAADFLPGVVASCELFAQQLAEAGVTVTIDEADPTTYFDDFATVLSTPAQGFFFINRPGVIHVASYTGSSSPFNITGFGTPTYDATVADMQATVDADERVTKTEELLTTLHEEDGLIIWGFDPQLDAAVPGIEGVELVQSVPVFWRATRA